MSASLKFEKEPCGRCGGTGHYSRCERYGTMCFDCAGTKFRDSRAGGRARKAWHSFIESRTAIPVRDIKPGMRVRSSIGEKFHTVLEVSEPYVSGSYTDPQGNRIATINRTIQWKGMGYSTGVDAVMYLPFTLEQMREFVSTQPAGVELIEAE